MNLTSKRMLQFAMVCAGVCALSASATQFIGDSFEGPEGTNGMPVAYYKATLGENNEITEAKWVVSAGDASALVAADVANQDYAAATRPMSGVVSNRVLNLETEGQTLTRTVDGAPINFTAAPAWVDTLIKFTPSEDDPVIDDILVKAAVFVNVSSNLTIYHGVDGESPAMTPVGIQIDPEQWYRLTIQLGVQPGYEFKAFKVLLDGVLVTSSAAYTDTSDAPVEGGYWFMSPSISETLNAVAFQGTGMVDELVVTSDEVSFENVSSVVLTLSFDSGLVTVAQGGVPLTTGAEVESGETIEIAAADWRELVSVNGTDVTYDGPVGAMVLASTGTVSALASTTVTFTTQPYSGTGAISTGLGGTQPADKVAEWALANSLGAGDLDSDMLDDYLCNVAPATNPELKVLSVVFDQENEEATIVVGTTGSTVDFDSINGTLKVSTRDDLSNSSNWSDPIEVPVTVEDPNTTATVVVDLTGFNGVFIKAVIN